MTMILYIICATNLSIYLIILFFNSIVGEGILNPRISSWKTLKSVN
jgi:hypothetical protein